MDALIPMVAELHVASSEEVNGRTIIEKALKAAETGTDTTKQMISTFGRSTYVGAGAGGDSSGKKTTEGIPDPGACGVVAIARGILDAYNASPDIL